MANFNLDDLLTLEPTTVSRDLSSYITYLYGAPKVGKTTLARDMQALILACEDGTRAITGAYAQKMKSWADIRSIMRFCKDAKFKERYKAIAVDTVDACASLCEKYICNQLEIQTLGEGGWTKNGWAAFKKEFEEVFRTITMEGFAVLFISHDKTEEITRPDGSKYHRIIPTTPSSINNIIKNMSDLIIYGYCDPNTMERNMVLRSTDGMIEAGSRFAYIDNQISFGYQPLVDALNRAIDKEAEIKGEKVVVNDRVLENTKPAVDFDDLVNEFKTIIDNLINTHSPEEFNSVYNPRIVEITDKYLGIGKKVSTCTRAQVEQVELIVDELKDMVASLA